MQRTWNRYCRTNLLAYEVLRVNREYISKEEANRQIEIIMNARKTTNKMTELLGEKIASKYLSKLVNNIIYSIE